MRFRLRTLLILSALAPPLLAGAWFALTQVTADELRWGVFVLAHGFAAYVGYLALALWFRNRRTGNR